MSISRHREKGLTRSGGPKLAALVVAGGYSSRMGQFKPLLPFHGSTVIENTIGSFQAAGIDEITVVVGHRADELQSLLHPLPVRCVPNPNYDSGMFSSIVAGLQSLPSSIDACFLLPADMPLVRPGTIKQMAEAYGKNGYQVTYPIFQGQRGHPPILAATLFGTILAGSGEGGLRALLDKYEAAAGEVAVFDEGIHLDMDTPADYSACLELAGHRDVPSSAECNEILAAGNVDDRIVAHVRVVAAVAEKLAAALMAKGIPLDIGLIRAGGLLHDLTKGAPDHAGSGALAVAGLGFPKLAPVIASHTETIFEDGPLDEPALVHLADKLVQGESVVSLQERFQRPLDRFANDAAVLQAVMQRWDTAARIAEAVEQKVGRPLSEIVGGQ